VADEHAIRDLTTAIGSYRGLLEQLVSGGISADEFQTRYFKIYLADDSDFSDEVFVVVDSFFAEVDAYVDDERLRDESQGDLGPEQLRERARDLLRQAGYFD
jgi:hypothetical protein